MRSNQGPARPGMLPGGGRQKVWRISTHPVRSRTQSLGVVRCRSVFRMGLAISPTQNPAYCPAPNGFRHRCYR